MLECFFKIVYVSWLKVSLRGFSFDQSSRDDGLLEGSWVDDSRAPPRRLRMRDYLPARLHARESGAVDYPQSRSQSNCMPVRHRPGCCDELLQSRTLLKMASLKFDAGDSCVMLLLLSPSLQYLFLCMCECLFCLCVRMYICSASVHC